MTIMTAVSAPRRVDMPRDRWDRPMLPHPDTPKGPAKGWTRVTTLAKSLDDTYNLDLWKQRQVARGIAFRDDLRIAVGTTDPDDRDALNKLCERAMDAAKASKGADWGTAFHAVTAIRDAHPDVDPADYCPAELLADLAAYAAMVQAHGLIMPEAYIERGCVTPEVETAGTFDRLCYTSDRTRFRIGDVKTGKDEAEYGQTSIAIQLACYAHARVLWKADGSGYEDPPGIDKEIAYVLACPAGTATATLYEVDIATGWDLAQLAVRVRGNRKRKDLFREVSTGVLATSVEVDGVTHPAGESVTVKMPAKRARRTKAQIAADAAKAEENLRKAGNHRAADEAAEVHAQAIIDGAYDDDETTPVTAALDLTDPADAAIHESETRHDGATGETGTAFLMNGELKPGPAEPPFCPFGRGPCTSDCPDVQHRACVDGETDRPAVDMNDIARAKVMDEARRMRVANETRREAEGLIDQANSMSDLATLFTLYDGVWVPDMTWRGIRRLIDLAQSRETVAALFDAFASSWTPELTAYGMARLDRLAGGL